MPSPPVECFGRESVCERLIRAEREDGAAFLFGGPLAGKSTVLRRVHDGLAATSASKENRADPVIPILVELRQLGEDFAPLGFYRLLAAMASTALSGWLRDCGALAQAAPQTGGSTRRGRRVVRGALAQAAPQTGGLESFIGFLAELLERRGDCQPRLYFLLDDCKRLASFPRGFQDNLVHLLWGCHRVSGKVAIAFCGAQELHAFFLDQTTPLRSRSEIIYLENLPESALVQMASALGLEAPEQVVADVFPITGGHAGLSWLLLNRLALEANGGEHGAEGTVAEFCSAKQELMRSWYGRLSPEAKSLVAVLAAGGSVSRPSAASALREAGYEPALNIRAFNELTFTGMAVRDGANLKKAGRIFWDFFTTVETGTAAAPSATHASGSPFVFKRVGRRWWFRFDGVDYGRDHKQRDGFLYIAFLLGRGSQPTHCVELKLKCKQPPEGPARDLLEQLLSDINAGHGPKQKYVNRGTKIQWQEALEQLDELIAEAKAGGHPDRVEELENRKEWLELERSKQIGLAGRLRPETTQEALEDKTRKAVGKAMSEAIAYLKKHCPKLGEYLKDDTEGIECFSTWPQYRGQHDWDTQEVATRAVATS
jgi:hypothetical protein